MSRADDLIGRLQAEIVKRDARVAELEAQVSGIRLDVITQIDAHAVTREELAALKAQQPSAGCDTCHDQGEVFSGETAYQGHLQPPEPIMITCPECSGESLQPSAGVVLPELHVAVLDAFTAYERFGTDCLFKCVPMIHASVLEELAEVARLNPCRAQAVPLPYWEPCNPGCDPEFNGQRSMECAQLCNQARAAITASCAVAVTEGYVASEVKPNKPLCKHGCGRVAVYSFICECDECHSKTLSKQLGLPATQEESDQ